MMSTLKCVLFDLDDTLLDHSGASARALEKTHVLHEDALHGISFVDFRDAYHLVNQKLWALYESGKTSIHEVIADRYMHLCTHLQLDSSLAGRLNSTYLKLYIGYCQVKPGTQGVLELLYRRGLSLGIVSNGLPSIQEAKLAHTGIRRYFSDLFFGQKYPYCKPNGAYFRDLLRRLALPPEDILLVGDSMRNDVEPAIRMDFRVIWFNERGSVLPHPSSVVQMIHSMSELETFVGEDLHETSHKKCTDR